MQVSIESTGALGRRMKVALPPDRIEKEFTARLKKIAKNVRLPGFRQGKVPMKVVEAQYGGKLMQEIANELIQSTFQEAIGQEGLKPAGDPHIQPQSIERGKEFEYIAEFEIYPEITQIDLSGRKFEKPVCTIAPEDVERTLETLRKQRADWKPVSRAVQAGDRVLIDFKGMQDGAPVEGGSANDYALVVGSGTLVEGFDEGLLGASAGETRTVRVIFPVDHGSKGLAGKKVEFEVKIKSVEEAELPELNSDFARQFGIGDGSLDTLRAEVKKNLEREKEQRIRTLLKQRVMDTLVEANSIEVPQLLVQQEVERMRQGGRQTASDAADTTEYTEIARKRVKLGLIIGEVIRNRGITVDAAAVKSRIEEMATEYESPDQFIKWHYDNPRKLQEVQLQLMEEAAIQALLESAEVAEKPVTFQELVQMK